MRQCSDSWLIFFLSSLSFTILVSFIINNEWKKIIILGDMEKMFSLFKPLAVIIDRMREKKRKEEEKGLLTKGSVYFFLYISLSSQSRKDP